MRRIIYKSQAIQAVIVIAAVCLLLSLWPLRLWHETVKGGVERQTDSATFAVTEELIVLQSFVAQYGHLDSISLYIQDGTLDGTFWVRILNDAQVMIAEEQVIISQDAVPGYVKVPADIDTEVGQIYHCIIQGGKGTKLRLGCEKIVLQDMLQLAPMYYNNEIADSYNLVADYNYGVPLRKGKTVLFGLLTLVIAVMGVVAVRYYYKSRPEAEHLITVEKVFQWIANPLAAGLVLICLIGIFSGFCSSHLLDNCFFLISTIFLAILLFYGINHNRQGQESILTKEYLSTHIMDLLQSFFLAMTIRGCCEYMNGLYDIHHAVAERKEMFWFALTVIAMFRFGEIINLYNLVYMIAAGICGYIYYRSQWELILNSETVREAEQGLHKQVLVTTIWIAILFGLILLRTGIRFFRRRPAKLNYVYAGLLAVFFAAIIIFRNGRWWTVVLVAALTVLYLVYGMWEHRERFLVNLCRGIILQFLMATGYALLHRPYASYITARYPHIFHTVTITASYLTMVECAAIVMLLSKMRKSMQLRDIWKELTLFGVVSSYLLFTMARTGFFATFIMILFALVILGRGKGREWFAYFGKSVLFLMLAVFICFPVTFSLQRTIPALVSEPYLYEFELKRDDVLRGRKLNSADYMRVGRFIDLFADKIFGIPQGTFDIYGEHASYRKTHDVYGNEVAYLTDNDITTEQSVVDSGIEIASVSYQPESSGQSIEDLLSEGVLELGDIKPGGEEYENQDYTNGRTDIFRSYIQQLNMTGHEEMGAILQDGSIATHAHNIYLQVAYDHGILVGVLFVLTGMGSFLYACLYYKRNKDKITYAALPAVVIVAVAVAGMVEWIFHLSNPCGLVLMLAIAPLLFCEGQRDEREEQKRQTDF